MRSIMCAVLAGVVAWTQAARADGLIYQLPDDGTGVFYETETSFTRDGQERTVKGTLSISSVGKLTVDNEPCRWIEIKSVTTVDGQERISITKCLIAEKYLKKGEAPGQHLIRGWAKQGNDEPQAIKELSFPRARGLPGYLAGPAPNALELDAVEVDGKLGKLSCKGISGDLEFVRENGTVRTHFENRLHEKSPFGVVSAGWKTERTTNGQTMGGRTMKLTLVDINLNALSELADKN
jgi:hypothetical protein